MVERRKDNTESKTYLLRPQILESTCIMLKYTILTSNKQKLSRKVIVITHHITMRKADKCLNTRALASRWRKEHSAHKQTLKKRSNEESNANVHFILCFVGKSIFVHIPFGKVRQQKKTRKTRRRRGNTNEISKKSETCLGILSKQRHLASNH